MDLCSHKHCRDHERGKRTVMGVGMNPGRVVAASTDTFFLMSFDYVHPMFLSSKAPQFLPC